MAPPPNSPAQEASSAPRVSARNPAVPSPQKSAPAPDNGFECFYREHFRLVRNVLYARAQDWTLAADVADQAMMIAYRKWDDLNNHPNQVGFVITTARRILSRVQRRQAAKSAPNQPLSLDALSYLDQYSPSPDPADIVSARLALDQALKALPADQRECFVLHEIHDHPIRTIAALLNIPEGTIKTRLRAARSALRELLNDDPGEGDTQ